MLRAEARDTQTPDFRAHHQIHGVDAGERRSLHSWGKDAAKLKDYLLPLLFLKRLSDVFDDESDRLAADYGDRALSFPKRAPLGTCFRGGAFRFQRQHTV